MRKVTAGACGVLLLFALTAYKCGSSNSSDSSDANLRTIDTVRLTGPTRITNGQSDTYTVTVTRASGSVGTRSGTVELRGSGVGYNTVLGTGALDIPAGSNDGTKTITLNCAPSGKEGKLAGVQGGSGHGSRVCRSVGPAVVCTDDPVTLQATFREGQSSTISVVCKPSTGPTEGSTPPPAPTLPKPPKLPKP